MPTRRLYTAGAALAMTCLVTACAPKPLDELTLPGGVATGDSGYTLTAYFANTDNLIPNAQVMYQDKVIGTVRSIAFDTDADKRWRAKVRFSLLRSEPLPANITLKVGQKSLLGAEYLEVDVPDGSTVQNQGTLLSHVDDAIPETRTGSYPETEEVLAGVALLLGNGGLAQIKTITTELSDLLSGPAKQDAARGVITQLNTLFSTLNGQKDQLVNLIGAVDRLGTLLDDQKATIGSAIDQLDPGLQLLVQEQPKLTSTLQAVSNLAQVGNQVISESGGALTSNLKSLEPVLSALQSVSQQIPSAVEAVAVYPFPVRAVPYSLRGDYGNLAITLDLTLGDLSKDFTGVDPSQLQSILAAAAKGDATPGVAALSHLLGTATTPATVTGSSASTTSTGTTSGGASSTSSTASTNNPLCALLGVLLGGC